MALTRKETSSLLSTVMKLNWPARKVAIQVAYDVSRAAQEARAATVQTVREVKKVAARLKSLEVAGQIKLWFCAVDMRYPLVVTPYDVSFAREARHKSQAGFVSLASDGRVKEGPAYCGLIEHSTNRIHCVVRSTMAAESASLSLAMDRQLYARLLWQHLAWGPAPVNADWRDQLIIDGIVVTDAKSLFDHLGRTEGVPTER